MEFTTHSEGDVLEVAKYVNNIINPGSIVVLNGDLGAGKTTLVKFIAKEMGITEVITSPTFNIMKEYNGILCHIDAYRVIGEDIGLDHYIDGKYITYIEWAKNIEDYIPFVSLTIDISYIENGRKFVITEEKC